MKRDVNIERSRPPVLTDLHSTQRLLSNATGGLTTVK